MKAVSPNSEQQQPKDLHYLLIHSGCSLAEAKENSLFDLRNIIILHKNENAGQSFIMHSIRWNTKILPLAYIRMIHIETSIIESFLSRFSDLSSQPVAATSELLLGQSVGLSRPSTLTECVLILSLPFLLANRNVTV